MKISPKIVLVNPSHPGNIGATARAMKTMELSELILVNPKNFPNVNATAMAAGADDILANAKVVESLPEALIGCQLIFGTSARLRAIPLALLTPKEAAKIIAKSALVSKIAVVFGRENNGLSNEELGLCNYQLHIPTNPEFSSLNIASAVQLICYEIKMALMEKKTDIEETRSDLAPSEEILRLYQHLEETLVKIEFLYQANNTGIMAKIKRLFNRAQLENSEIKILRGILTAINQRTIKNEP